MPVKITASLFLIIIAAISVVSPRIHTHQHTLEPLKQSPKPIIFPLNKEKRSPDVQKQLFSFLQKHQERLKTSSFLQQDITPTNIDQEKIPAVLGLDNFHNTQYLGIIGLGNSDNTYKVIFDTGSTPLFVNSAYCSETACLHHPQFDPRTSETVMVSDPPMGMKVTYGSGELEGVHVHEDVYVGDLKAPQMSLYLILHQTHILDTSLFDGVAGLGFPEENELGEEKVISLFDALKDQLPDPFFSFYLRRNDEENSYVMFGGYNEDHMASDLVWHDVIHPNYWMLKLTNIYVGEHKIEFCQTHDCGVVIDSGTSLITAPSMAIWEMQSFLPQVACSERDKLPPVTFEIESQRYPIDPDEYILTIDSEGQPEFFTHSEDTIQCTGLFTPMDIQTSDAKIIFILGDTFLTKFYAVFDRESNRIGMALQKR